MYCADARIAALFLNLTGNLVKSLLYFLIQGFASFGVV